MCLFLQLNLLYLAFATRDFAPMFKICRNESRKRRARYTDTSQGTTGATTIVASKCHCTTHYFVLKVSYHCKVSACLANIARSSCIFNRLAAQDHAHSPSFSICIWLCICPNIIFIARWTHHYSFLLCGFVI